jgi:hypothetical protein
VDEATDGAQSPLTVEETLKQIRVAPLKTQDEFTADMKLIDNIKSQFDPMRIAMLQMAAVIKHYNLNKKATDEEMTLVDALLLDLAARKHHPD